MKRILISILLTMFVTVGASAEKGFDGRPILNNVSSPTGFTLNKGEFTVGLGSIGFGITDRVKIGTNILLYLFQVYNADVKVNLISSDAVSLSAGLDLNYFNLDVFGADTGFTSLSPYIAISPRLSDRTILHIGGRYSYFSGSADIEDAEVSEAARGTSFFTGIEYSFSHKTKFLTEAGYDTTFKGLRLGGAVLWGWDKFRLKLGINYFNPENTGSFTFPVIGLWWRFNG